MPFDLNNLNPPLRFFWPDDPKNEEWVDFRLVADRERLAIIKEVGLDRKVVFKANPLTKAMNRIEYADTSIEKGEEFLHRMYDLQIVDWNLKTPKPDVKSIPCTKKNKVLLMTGSEKFNKWAEECLETLAATGKKEEEELEKNE